MTASTTKYVIPYPQSSDTVASLAAQVQNLANRVDLLMGESGTFSKTLVANTDTTQAITLSRTYPGNTGAATPGFVAVTYVSTVGSTITQFVWVDSWTGSATTITGFTIHIMSSNATTRSFAWRFIPAL